MSTDALAPQPGEASKKSPVARIVLRVFLSGLALLILATAASIFDISRKLNLKAARVEMERDLHSIHFPLFEFEAKYGEFPSAKTLAKLTAETGEAPWPLVSSNDYLRQLVVAGLVGEEQFRDSGRSGWTKAPDGVAVPREKALEAGECAYAYIPGGSDDDPLRPILLYPLIPGTLRFDPKPLKGVAMILTAEGVRDQLVITKDGRVMVNGSDIFDPAQPWWRGKVPEVKYPEARSK